MSELPKVGDKIKVTGVPGYINWREKLPHTTDDIHTVVAPGYSDPERVYVRARSGAPYYVEWDKEWQPSVEWEVGTKFTIPPNDNDTVYTIHGGPHTNDTEYVYGVSWTNSHGSTTQGSRSAYSKSSIDNAFRAGTWKLYEEPTEMTDTETIEAGPMTRSELDALRTEVESLKVELASARNGAANFKDDMLTAMCEYAEDPECGCDRYCTSFDAFMIRRGYTAREVEQARIDCVKKERHIITIEIEGRAGVGGEWAVAAALAERVPTLDSDWSVVQHDVMPYEE